DAVVLYETWNDMSHYRELESGPYRAGPSQPNRPWWERLARWSQIGRRAHPNFPRPQRQLRDAGVRAAASRPAHLDRPADTPAPPWDSQNFVDFAKFARQDGVLPILMTMAFLGSQESLNDDEIRRRVEAGCIERGFNAQRGLETFLEMSRTIREVAAKN